MNRRMKLLAIFLAIISVMTIAIQPAKANSNMLALEKNYESIFVNYANNVYEALYSINELRPYSIIQLDKTMEIYDNEWIAPETFAAMLDDEDKKVLKNQVFLLIAGMEGSKRDQVMNKLHSWCVNDIQMHIIINDFNIPRHRLITSMYSLPLTNTILDSYNERGSIDAAQLKEIQINKAYHNALNIISSIEVKHQLKYHSDLFADLSLKFD